ncbi:RIP metalloprotease [Hyphomonas sp. FCG-A18]|uniref:M50 family metallopeptidase n=1 Tax=Hyphomonas sp. FCG-A18 TaxID=3080019 RepID=UPI002B2C0950|nr:RIP metalloprotease [Hyphomonas sp. FCG-A18]
MGEILSQGPLFILSLAFMLGVVVTIHELGHYWAGRWAGAAVESFSVGFGKSIFERKDKRNTRWRINWIPLGGFVKFVGESQLPNDVGKVEQGPIGKAYYEIGPGKRAFISVAGPLANFILAILLFAMFFSLRGVEYYDVAVAGVSEDMPAAEAGFEVGDVITHLEGERLRTVEDLMAVTSISSGRSLDMTLRRDGELIETSVTPIRVTRPNALGQIVPQGTIGIVPLPMAGTIEFEQVGPFTGLYKGVIQTKITLERTTTMLSRIVTGHEPVASLSGPVAIGDAGRRVVNITLGNEQVPLGQRWSNLFWTMVQLCAAISIGLGFFNILPFPILDGGHIVGCAYEAVTGQRVPERVTEYVLRAALVVILTLFVFITWGDIIETGLFNTTTG